MHRDCSGSKLRRELLTCTVAAAVVRMTEPTTSPGTTSKTLCALWHVIVQMPAARQQLSAPCQAKAFHPSHKAINLDAATSGIPNKCCIYDLYVIWKGALHTNQEDQMWKFARGNAGHTAAVGQKVGGGAGAVAKIAGEGMPCNGALHAQVDFLKTPHRSNTSLSAMQALQLHPLLISS